MSDSNTAVIVDAVRTARGKKKGTLAGVHPMDLAAHALSAALRRTGVDPQRVDDVVLGCVSQVGEQGLNIARGAVLASGMPIEVAGATVNRFCGSGLQAVNFAAMQVMSGQADLAIGGGVESMNRVPMGSDAEGPGSPAAPSLVERFPNLVPQGVSAELIAEQWKLSRAQVDEFALSSQQKAGAAIRDGRFTKEIDPFLVTGADGQRVGFATDEHCRPGTTMEALAGLRPVFKENGVIHAGNSSGIVDGAAAVVVASDKAARAWGLPRRARIVATAVAGSDPVLMLTGPIPSTRKALARAGLSVKDIDLWEINEAFAPVPIVVAQELGISPDRVNVNGGAIALGHPLGATGAMLVATLLSELERRDLRYGAVTLCIGYGMGVTTIIDRQVG
ncbi:acetyl-CoA C-acyltransferase [Myxococcaceae bacterium JPH2]|nr:acetyl-CoA C-acyltransferase [Myxococcaceae bacterium JPH2]